MRTVEDLARRQAIEQYHVLGEPAEPDLQGLVELAAIVCEVPTAVINIIDDRDQHQIAAVGFAPGVCEREDSMCAVVLDEARRVEVFDAREDDRFVDNPFVTGEIAKVRFYASSPLVTPGGVVIGTLCVFDESTGELSGERRTASTCSPARSSTSSSCGAPPASWRARTSSSPSSPGRSATTCATPWRRCPGSSRSRPTASRSTQPRTSRTPSAGRSVGPTYAAAHLRAALAPRNGVEFQPVQPAAILLKV